MVEAKRKYTTLDLSKYLWPDWSPNAWKHLILVWMKHGSCYITASLCCGGSVLFLCTHTPNILNTQNFITVALPKAMMRLPELEGNNESLLPEESEIFGKRKHIHKILLNRKTSVNCKEKHLRQKKIMCLTYIGSWMILKPVSFDNFDGNVSCVSTSISRK